MQPVTLNSARLRIKAVNAYPIFGDLFLFVAVFDAKTLLLMNSLKNVARDGTHMDLLGRY